MVEDDALVTLRHWLTDYIERHSGAEAAPLLEGLGRLAQDRPQRSILVHQALQALEPLSPDAETVLATLLLPVMLDRQLEPQELAEHLSASTLKLLGQLKQLQYFGRTYLPDDSARAEGLRRLLLALVEDVRVVLIALAWQLARLKLAADLDEQTRQSIARETQLIHAPLANRLGIGQLKWQLEDLAFQYLEPQAYRQIRLLLAERQADREAYVNAFMTQLKHVVGEVGIKAEISGRAKHVYSIWRKMQRKGLDFHELFDVRAVRVMVDSVAECYSVLGLVHTHWQPVPGEFDDYITNPKPNLYQSLHTAVTGAKGRAVEVQIRTHDMHRHAELGVAAHWRYKEGGPRDAGLEKRIGVMRQLLEGAEGESDGSSLLEDFQNLTTEDRVYVLTPRGEVKDMVAGATPLDFAYLVHTEVGHRCRGARVNGRIVPLTT
ncbi:MAG: bifunctional (p)ppGpp synthetase/guanosine-3',5'-bis(diphosphate) 3'-pyrophosphohydrolase, partial [Wenzhouxiangellaceae bacterium]